MNSKDKQIRNLVAVLGSGVAAAILFALFMLHYYGPTGSYVAGNALLSPEMITQLSSHGAKVKTRFSVEDISFSYFDSKQWRKKTISLEAYANLYNVLKGDKSLSPADESTIRQFNKGPLATVSFTIKSDNDVAPKLFQEIQFANEGNVYRIMSLNGEWIYMQHSKIYQKTLDLLTK